MHQKFFYITTTLPYVNATPHIGFAQEIVAADVFARYQRTLGTEVFFNTGTDEHGQKIYQKALEQNRDPQSYVNDYAKHFKDLQGLLNLSFNSFIRTTNPKHVAAAQEFWRRCEANGDIYKRMYTLTYCVGCELEKQASELENGRCPLHPNQELEVREEENYFFRFSRYQQSLLNIYENVTDFVVPESKLKEITAFVAGGLQDFSISRLKEKMSWGIPVPGDEDHVMYVWFDALVNYVSALGWPDNEAQVEKFWPGVQVAGKDNLRQQSAMWQAMLLSAGLKASEKILINGFISVDGQKMSKSLGNVISPDEMVERYGVDASRYLLMNLNPFGEDMDVTWEKLDNAYTADLANGLGNLVSRLAKLAEKNGLTTAEAIPQDEGSKMQALLDSTDLKRVTDQYTQAMTDFNPGLALKSVFLDVVDSETVKSTMHMSVSTLDKYLAVEQPWKLSAEVAEPILNKAIADLMQIATKLTPFMPDTAAYIIEHFSESKLRAADPLFPRLEK